MSVVVRMEVGLSARQPDHAGRGAPPSALHHGVVRAAKGNLP